MPMVATYRGGTIILLAKIVNQYFESKDVLAHQFQRFESGSVRIKGSKTLYLAIVRLKHTASYTD